MSFKSAIRIVTVDSYMSSPIQDLDVMYSDFRGSSINQVPIIRIFGSTDSGFYIQILKFTTKSTKF